MLRTRATKHTKDILILLLVLLCSFMLAACSSSPVSLIGKNYVIEQGAELPSDITTYVTGKDEELAKCTLDGSSVNTAVVGTYNASIVHPDKTISFTVQVVDTTSPVVELYTNEIYAAPGQVINLYDVMKAVQDTTSFQAGFADDITKADADKILYQTLEYSAPGAYNSEVCAKDAYGNITVVPIIIIVNEDAVAPVISGISATEYTNMGVAVDYLSRITATDDVDGDVTANVVVDTSGVDFYTAGEYTLTVSASDKSGNVTTMVVKVVVSDTTANMNPGPTVVVDGNSDFSEFSSEYVPYGFGKDYDENNRPTGVQWYANKFGKYAADFIQPLSNNIYLTFDEGYEYGYTSSILDTLKEKNVKAVFFVTLPFAKENPDLIQRMIDEGHVVGNHSATHPSEGLSSLSVDAQIEEVMRVHDYIYENFGYEMYLFRFPTGALSEQSLAIVQSLGYRSVFWSFAYQDWYTDNQPDVQESLENALNKAHGGAIYLLHAVSSTNTAMLGDFIDGCRAKGFEFGYYSKIN